MRNSSLLYSLLRGDRKGCAENVTGLKCSTEDAVPPQFLWKLGREVGERSLGAEVVLARDGGASGSENVGMSNRKSSEILGHRKPKVSSAMEINRGLAGPKANFGQRR